MRNDELKTASLLTFITHHSAFIIYQGRTFAPGFDAPLVKAFVPASSVESSAGLVCSSSGSGESVLTATLFACKVEPVARLSAETALFKSVCACSSRPRAASNSV